ncbi:MAG: peptidoglycan-binding protein [Verrucomicrobia bacterium]|nr:peptidoglycan-binding protein [Verrucomicrobiota bacterium]
MKLHVFLVCWLGLVTLSCADDVTRTLQQKLKDQGFYYGEVTGQNSSETAAALRRYQIRYGLRVTGEADTETLRSLGVGGNAGSPAAGRTPSRGWNQVMPEPPPVEKAPPVAGHTPSKPPSHAVASPSPVKKTPPATSNSNPPASANRSVRSVPAPAPVDRGDDAREPDRGDSDRDRDQRYNGDRPDDPYEAPAERPEAGERAVPAVPPSDDSGDYEFGWTASGSFLAGSVYERAPRQVQRNVIYTVQVLLGRRGVYRGDVNGMPGRAISEAVAVFQQDEGLPVTGRLDQETLRELHALPGQRNGPSARDAQYTLPPPQEDRRVYRGIWINR